MSSTQACFVLLGFCVAGFIKGASGLGFSTCALPFLVAGVGLKNGMGLVLLPAMAGNVGVLFGPGDRRAVLRRFWPLYAATFPGIAIGASLLGIVDQGTAAATLGGLVIAYSVMAMGRAQWVCPLGWERPLLVPVGVMNGFFTGLTGSQVMPMVPYMQALQMSADEFVQANNIAVMFASLILVGALAIAGALDWNLVVLSLIGVVPTLGCVHLGTKIRRLVPSHLFRRFVLVVLVIMGGALIVKF